MNERAKVHKATITSQPTSYFLMHNKAICERVIWIGVCAMIVHFLMCNMQILFKCLVFLECIYV